MSDKNLTTSPGKRSASPEAVVDALFARFAAFYGKHWLDLWADIPVAAVKAEWAYRLQSMPMDALRLAVEHLLKHSKFPPTLPEFYTLCDQFKPREAPRLHLTESREGTTMPEHVRKMLKDRGLLSA